MPRPVKAMTDDEVAALDRPGRHAVGGVSGLTLKITASGARSWVLRTWVSGRRREFGLGGFPTTTLEQARERARGKLDQVWQQEHGDT